MSSEFVDLTTIHADTSMYQAINQTLKSLSPNKKALFFEGNSVSVKKLLMLIDKFSYHLKQMGIKEGDVVTMNLPNLVNAVVLFYAANKLGAIVNSLHPLLPPNYIAKSVTELNSKLLITLDSYYDKGVSCLGQLNTNVLLCSVSDYLPLIKKIVYKNSEKRYLQYASSRYFYRDLVRMNHGSVETQINDTAVYLHSGGTTNVPKTIKLTNFAFNSLADSLIRIIDNKDAYANTGLMVLPIFHGFGLGVCMHAHLTAGFSIALIARFNAKKTAKVCRKHNVTIAAGVPLMYEKLLSLDDKHFCMLKGIKYLFCGGDKLSFMLKKAFDDRLLSFNSSAELLEGYGLTECVTVCTVNKQNDYEENSMGLPLHGIRLRAIDVNTLEPLEIGQRGEICVAGNTLMQGYLNDDHGFIMLDGVKYIRTGDFGYLSNDGKLFFIDRLKRIIKISGVTIFPSDIEKAASQVKGVSVSAVSYDESQKRLVLHIETSENDKERLKDLILQKCKEELVPYAVPKEIVFYDKLPRTVVGKVKV